MKNIKFRGWHKEKKAMFDVFGFDVNHVYSFKTEGLEIPPEREEVELMQYTGLKDINGKEICEGDLLEFEIEDELGNFINVVIWEKGCFALRAEKEYDYVDYPLFEWINGRIIGNIYENPELLAKIKIYEK